MHNNKQKAINLFLEKMTEYSINDIVEIIEIHTGFTNQSFYLKMNDNEEFQIRIGQNNDIVSRENEEQVLLCIDDKNYIFYDVQTGNAIKKWIKGKHVTENEISEKFLANLLKKINQFHSHDFQKYKILRHNYYVFFNPAFLPKNHQEAYKKFVSQISDKNWVLSHNDLNLQNLLINEQDEIIFLDFEWSRINHPLWDIANFIRESELDTKKIQFIANQLNIEYKELMQFVYICTNFAYQWTFSTSYDEKISKYRKNTLILMENYLDILNSME